MEKIIKVGEYEFKAKSTAASLFSYKANFGRDGLRDIIALASGINGGEMSIEKIITSDSFDLDVFFRFLWVFAKAADKDIPPLEQWLEGFDIPPVDFACQSLSQILDLLMSTAKSTIKSKNLPAAVRKK